MSDPTPDIPKNPPPLMESLPEDDEPVIMSAGSAQRQSAGRAARSQASPQVEAALRQSNLLRVRGDLAGAERELRNALELDPAAGSVHEMLGDMLAQAGEREKALASYRRAQSCGAGPAVEAKIGRLIVVNNPEIEAIRDSPLVRGQGAVAFIASALIPGLGIALAGEMRPAIIAFTGWIVTLGLISVIPATHQALESLFRGGAGTAASPRALFLLLILALANLGFYMYSLIETARVAKPAEKDGIDD